MNKNSGRYIKKAVAMEYFKKKGRAPRIIAKGKGILAEKIVELANKNNVPLFKDKNLCNLFMNTDVGKEIPESLYKAAVEVLSYVYWLKRRSNNK